MKIKEILEISKAALNDTFVHRKSFICETLLSNIIKKPRIYLHCNDNKILESNILDSMINVINLINNNYPIEYITNKVSFYSNTFYIAEGALIPRPETEILIDKVSNIINKYNLEYIYEIGVGSGVISITLALLHKNLKIIATDISNKALNIAHKNIYIQSKKDPTLPARIKLIYTNLLDSININKNNLIVSNPPYIKNNFNVDRNLNYEPKEALFGGEVGDEILKQIIDIDNKFICCEIGYNQQYLQQYLQQYDNVEFYKDYSGFTRGFIAIKI